MNEKLEKIVSFIDKHHVMSLATALEDEVSVCSLFYAYEKEKKCFVVASNDETLHIQHISKNNKVAGNILLETKTVGKIQGLQFRGLFLPMEDEGLKKIYFKAFPHARVMNPKLWYIDVDYFKLTDNQLGFGKKIIWQK